MLSKLTKCELLHVLTCLYGEAEVIERVRTNKRMRIADGLEHLLACKACYVIERKLGV